MGGVLRKRVLEAIGFGQLLLSHRERLAFRYLRGDGIEIGALANPLRVPRTARVRYIDNTPTSENEARFPELAGTRIVAPDIVTDGFTLDLVDDGTVDFVIANHVLEHAPDPIGVLLNWVRVLRPGGVIYVTVPLAERCFDRGREITDIDHMIDDHRLALEDPSALMRKNEMHYREWLTISEPNLLGDRGEPRAPLSDEELESSIARLTEDQTEIHFHAFSAASYEILLRHVLGYAGGRVLEVSVAPDASEAVGIAATRSGHG